MSKFERFWISVFARQSAYHREDLFVRRGSIFGDVEAKRLSALESQIAELKSLAFQSASYSDSESKKGAPESGFEPESEPRQGWSQAKLAPARSARP